LGELRIGQRVKVLPDPAESALLGQASQRGGWNRVCTQQRVSGKGHWEGE